MANATFVLLGSQVLSTTASSVTFSSIPQTFTDLKLVMSLRSSFNAGVNFDYCFYTFNGDSSSLYSYTGLTGTGSAASSARMSNSSSLIGQYFSSSYATANTFGPGEMYLPNYTSTSAKQVYIYGAGESNSTSEYMQFTAGLYRGTSAITSITLTLGNGPNFVANSSFYLYGIKNS